MSAADVDRPAVVRERRGAGRGELGHLGELAPRLSLADRGHEPGRDDGLLARALDQRRRARTPSRRRGRCSASRGSRSTRPPRLPPCRSEASPRPRGRECGDGRAGRRTRARSRAALAGAGSIAADDAVRDGDPQALVDPLRRGDHPCPRGRASRRGRSGTRGIMRPPAARRARPRARAWTSPRAGRTSTAMRTTRPARTWSTTSAASESATRGSISTPRFIGPGCMTTWPGRTRSGVIP